MMMNPNPEFCPEPESKTETSDSAKRIGIVLYPTFDALDAMGAHQVFFFCGLSHPGTQVKLIGPSCTDLRHPSLHFFLEDCEKGFLTSAEGITMIPDWSYEDYLNDETGMYSLDMIYVVGAKYPNIPLYMGPSREENNFFKMLYKANEEVQIIASVCNGALLLGASGLLAGKKVTTHWRFASTLNQFPDIWLDSRYPRYIVDGNVVTGGGISSTIDEAFIISSILFDEQTAKRTQLMMQYNPQPPFSCGDPDQADAQTLFQLRAKAHNEPGFDRVGRDFLEFIEKNN